MAQLLSASPFQVLFLLMWLASQPVYLLWPALVAVKLPDLSPLDLEVVRCPAQIDWQLIACCQDVSSPPQAPLRLQITGGQRVSSPARVSLQGARLLSSWRVGFVCICVFDQADIPQIPITR